MTGSGRVGDEGAVGGGGWTVYVLRCRDRSLYTGITIDAERRLAQHRDGTASRYTRSRRPVTMVYRESCASRSAALKREAAVKSLSREAKERLIDGARGGSISITRLQRKAGTPC